MIDRTWGNVTATPIIDQRDTALQLINSLPAQHVDFLPMALDALMLGLDCHAAGVALLNGSGETVDIVAYQSNQTSSNLPQQLWLADCPCKALYDDSTKDSYFVVTEKLNERFANNPLFGNPTLKSYRGELFFTSQGTPLGHIFALYDRELIDTSQNRLFFRLLSQRIGIEYLRVQTAQALRGSEQRFRDFAQSSSDWFWEMDANLRVSWVSKSVEKIIGVAREQFYGKTRDEFGKFDIEPEQWQQHIATLKARRPYRNFEFRLRTSNGLRWVNSHGVPVFNDSGQFQGYRGSATDITERKEFEQTLYESEERYRQVFAAEKDANLLFYGDTLEFFDVNDAALDLYGYSKEELLQLKSIDLSAEPDKSRAFVNQVLACQRGDVELRHHKRKDGSTFPVEISMSAFTLKQRPVICAVIRDSTETYELTQKLAYQASHDALTGLVNRREFEKRLQQTLLKPQTENSPHVLCYLDLDQFKIVNDTVGHQAGDELLKQVTQLFKREVRSRDTLARLGGDEFGLLLENCSIENACEITETLLKKLNAFRFVWQDRSFQLGVSIGLVAIDKQTLTLEQLLAQADIACYTAKDQGRNQICIYNKQDAEFNRRHSELLLASDLRTALKQNRFCLYKQRIQPFSQTVNQGAFYELFLRLIDNSGCLLLPNQFIPVAERYGLMNTIDRWVIKTLLANFNHWFPRGGNNNILIGINLSANSLIDRKLPDYVQSLFAEYAIPPATICFEITETAVISNVEQAIHFITRMRDLGCRFALDDFGNGLSSFSYLKRIPADYLKIDRGFTHDIATTTTNRAIVQAIQQISQGLNMQTIAEAVETETTLQILHELAIDHAQGYAIAKPERLPFRQTGTPHLRLITA